jgi:ABC-type multidrug transport system ATPase subunit
MTSYLQISGLGKQYGLISALRGIDLEVERGSVLALLGPNGAGKSTLFGCLLGLTLPTTGRMLLEGRPITNEDRARFGYMAERVALYPQRTVAENANFFAQLKGQPGSAIGKTLKRVGLYAVRNRKVRQLSKGMLQRLGIAIALCGEPELLVLDEPFNGLDPALLDTFQKILTEEQRRGATLLISTHTMSAVDPLATHAAILFEGQVAGFGSLQDLRIEHGEFDSLETIYQLIARRRNVAEEMFV